MSTWRCRLCRGPAVWPHNLCSTCREDLDARLRDGTNPKDGEQ